MGRLLLIRRLATKDIRRRPAQALLLVLAIAAAATILTLGLALRGATDNPFGRTQSATNGPDEARRPRRGSAACGKLDRWYVRDVLRRVAREAGLPDALVNNLHPHVFRASCATIAAAAGEPLAEIQRLLGHADPRTTTGYIERTRRLAPSPAYVVAAMIAPADRRPYRGRK